MSTKWTIDPMHSEIEFKVKHLMISTVTGKFTSFTAEAETENDEFTNANISFSADVNSITTGNEQRDGHLKSDDFFNVEQFPALTFKSTHLSKDANGAITLTGDLTIRDITKSVVLTGEFNGLMTDFYGNVKAGFELAGKLNRKDYNLKWTATTEAGGVVVSDEVKLICNIQMTKVA
ncbi:MAG: YceI family protein [Bacteroidia bacterium]|nr:YceI family protein [Bacteroidia bacterium]MCF8425261.1 YceI family protein [Bacteroidia bacterium]MCF8446517.1 YceI family protein [Bacteroidia bacterium]